ncbi:MAG: S41 family peptidase [Pedobacter sp.]|jgi:C-terminal processing protease CtpA/Prc|uniref:S41 family peptidase n=1 Tax=Pedobacter sp. TaxID=1411316 RepID=UPI003567F3E4
MKIKLLVAILAISIITITGCKKTKVTPAPTPDPPIVPVVATRAELSKDSIFLYAKEIYYWNDALPTYQAFNPRSYTNASTDLGNYNNELFAITRYKINPSTGLSYEYYASDPTDTKYSYIQDITTKNPSAFVADKKSSVDLEGNGNDFGIRLGFYGSNASYTIYATAIYQGSPAATAGFLRGDKITKINGAEYGTNFPSQISAIETALNGTTIKLEGINSAGNNFNITLTKAVFKSSPIYKKKILTAGTRKIGYLAYARFSTLTNSQPEFDAAFADFATAGVTDLIVDLRYNGGGYIETAEYLINLIAPSSLSGSVMFTEHYNTTMQNNQATILKNQPLLDRNNKVQYSNGKIVNLYDYMTNPYSVANNTSKFAKKGPLNSVANVVFIVSGSTASASELVINSLKPHVTVKLVGLTTYGKPVGFFPVTIENKYDVYFSLFETKNSLGQGGYYTGIVPDVSASEVPANTVMYDFGNVNDNYLKLALNSLNLGVPVTGQAKTLSAARERSLAVQSSEVINSDLNNNEFKGMIENRTRRKN